MLSKITEKQTLNYNSNTHAFEREETFHKIETRDPPFKPKQSPIGSDFKRLKMLSNIWKHFLMECISA